MPTTRSGPTRPSWPPPSKRSRRREANVAQLQALVAYSNILAPFDGVVTRRYADTGALVQAGTVQSGTGSNSDSMPLVSFAQLNILRLEFPVPEEDVPYVHVGDVVQVTVSAMGKTFAGKVARFADKVDMSTRTMLTEVDVDNSNYLYTPGMYATVRLTLAQQKNVLTVPIQSLDTGDNPSVLIVKDDRIEKRDVQVGLETPDAGRNTAAGWRRATWWLSGNRGSLQLGEQVSPQLVERRRHESPCSFLISAVAVTLRRHAPIFHPLSLLHHRPLPDRLRGRHHRA